MFDDILRRFLTTGQLPPGFKAVPTPDGIAIMGDLNGLMGGGAANGEFERPVIVGSLNQAEMEKAQEIDDYEAKEARLKEQIKMLHAKRHIAETELSHMVQDRIKLPPNKPMHINVETRQVLTERVVAEELGIEFTSPGEKVEAPATNQTPPQQEG